MNLIFSKIIDYYTLNPINGFHRNKSKESQYTYLPTQTPKMMDGGVFYQAYPADVLFDLSQVRVHDGNKVIR